MFLMTRQYVVMWKTNRGLFNEVPFKTAFKGEEGIGKSDMLRDVLF